MEENIHVISIKTRDAQHFLDKVDEADGTIVYMEIDKRHTHMCDAAISISDENLEKIRPFLVCEGNPNLISPLYKWEVKQTVAA